MSPLAFFDSLRRAFRWHRCWFAAALTALALLGVLNTVSAHASGSVPVIIATHTIAAGQTISSDDLAIAWLPPAVVPEGAYTESSQAWEKVAAVEIPRNSIMAPSLVAEDMTNASGKLTLPVRFSDSSAVSLLRVGNRLDIIGPATDGSNSAFVVVAENLRVVALSGSEGSGMLATSTPLVLLEVDRAQATAIAAASSVSSVSFAIH